LLPDIGLFSWLHLLLENSSSPNLTISMWGRRHANNLYIGIAPGPLMRELQ
jgi:hypothetical protein